jgi:hypothetical protein
MHHGKSRLLKGCNPSERKNKATYQAVVQQYQSRSGSTLLMYLITSQIEQAEKLDEAFANLDEYCICIVARLTCLLAKTIQLVSGVVASTGYVVAKGQWVYYISLSYPVS